MLYESIQLDKKFIKFRSLLGVGEATAIGHLACMWMSCWRQASEVLGDASDVELAAAWTGEPGKLFSALRDGGWIDSDENGLWCVHDFWDYAPRHVKLRRDRIETRDKENNKKKTEKPKATKRPQRAHSVRTKDAQSAHNNGVLVLASALALGEGVGEEIKNSAGADSPNSVTPDGCPMPPDKPRPRDEMFDALASTAMLDPKLAGSRIGKAKSQLVEAGYNAKDVKAYAELHKKQFAWQIDKGTYKPPTLPQIIEGIAQVRAKPPGAIGSFGPDGNQIHGDGWDDLSAEIKRKIRAGQQVC